MLGLIPWLLIRESFEQRGVGFQVGKTRPALEFRQGCL